MVRNLPKKSLQLSSKDWSAIFAKKRGLISISFPQGKDSKIGNEKGEFDRHMSNAEIHMCALLLTYIYIASEA